MFGWGVFRVFLLLGCVGEFSFVPSVCGDFCDGVLGGKRGRKKKRRDENGKEVYVCKLLERRANF